MYCTYDAVNLYDGVYQCEARMWRLSVGVKVVCACGGQGCVCQWGSRMCVSVGVEDVCVCGGQGCVCLLGSRMCVSVRSRMCVCGGQECVSVRLRMCVFGGQGCLSVGVKDVCLWGSRIPIYNYPHAIDSLSLIIVDIENYISNMIYDNQRFILILSS